MRVLPTLAVTAALLVAAPAVAATGKVSFDLSQSELKWTGRKVTGAHHGILKLRSAEGQIAEGNALQGTFEIDMASLRVDDIKDAKDNTKLTNHLKSDDFFNVASFPAAKFTITRSEPIAGAPSGQPNMMIHGDLSITGLTHPISFPALVEIKDGVVQARAEVKVDRTKYNIRYGSGKFFENLGDKLIYDEFSVELSMSGKIG